MLGCRTDYRGFTLIELMIVLIVSSLLLSLVGPLAFERLDSYRAKKEILDIRQKLRDVSNKAYVSGQTYWVRIDGTVMTISTGTHEQKINYELVSASGQNVRFNRNGFPDVTMLNLSNRGRNEQLKLVELIGFRSDDFVQIQ